AGSIGGQNMSANQVQKRPSAWVVRGALHLAASPRLPGARLVSRKWPFVRDKPYSTSTRGLSLVFPSQNTLLKPRLSCAIVALSSERVSGQSRRCLHAHGGGLCPRLDPGAGPCLTARFASGSGLRADLYGESQRRAARPATTAGRPRLYAGGRYARHLETRPPGALPAATARHG